MVVREFQDRCLKPLGHPSTPWYAWLFHSAQLTPECASRPSRKQKGPAEAGPRLTGVEIPAERMRRRRRSRASGSAGQVLLRAERDQGVLKELRALCVGGVHARTAAGAANRHSRHCGVMMALLFGGVGRRRNR